MPVHKNYFLKLKAVLPLFSAIAWGSVLVLGFIRWFFFLGKYPILELDEEIWNFWIPAFFPWIPILLWLKNDKLDFGKDIRGGNWTTQVFAWLAIWSMLLFSQHYLTTSTGKLLTLPNVKEIGRNEPVRYYRIDSFAVHMPIGGVQYAFRTSGRFNQNLIIDIYFVNPILTHKNQAITMTPLYWYGVNFHKQVGNLGTRAKREQRFQAFYNECLNKMKAYDFYHLDHFERTPPSFDRDQFRVAIQNALRRPVDPRVVILEPTTEPVGLRDGLKIAWTFLSYVIGIGMLMLVLIKPKLRSETEE
jgi:hypothetical protein